MAEWRGCSRSFGGDIRYSHLAVAMAYLHSGMVVQLAGPSPFQVGSGNSRISYTHGSGGSGHAGVGIFDQSFRKLLHFALACSTWRLACLPQVLSQARPETVSQDGS